MSIGEHCYVALARGGVADYHVLIVPIDCVPNRLHLSAPSKSELNQYEEALCTMFMNQRIHSLNKKQNNNPTANQDSNYLCVKFERAIRTKGKDHMQYQLIPLPASFFSLGSTVHTTKELYKSTGVADGCPPKLIDSKAISTFFQIISSYSLNFFELSSSLDTPPNVFNLDEVIINMEGGPYQEYFYVEIPCSYAIYHEHVTKQGVYSRRFLYVSNQTTDSKQK